MSMYQENYSHLAKFLKNTTAIKHLAMNHCGMSKQGIVNLAKGLKHNKSLQVLSLENNNFMDPKCIKYLVETM